MKRGRLLFIELILVGSIVACNCPSKVGNTSSAAQHDSTALDAGNINSNVASDLEESRKVPSMEDESLPIAPSDSARWKEEMKRKGGNAPEKPGNVVVPPKTEEQRRRMVVDDSIARAKIRLMPPTNWHDAPKPKAPSKDSLGGK